MTLSFACLTEAREMAEAALADAKRGTPGPWTAEDFEIYPSEGGPPEGGCENGCDGGCDDDPRAPIQCARVSHATEVIADVYGLQQFAAEDGALIATMRTREPLLAAWVVELVDECERLATENARWQRACSPLPGQRCMRCHQPAPNPMGCALCNVPRLTARLTESLAEIVTLRAEVEELRRELALRGDK